MSYASSDSDAVSKMESDTVWEKVNAKLKLKFAAKNENNNNKQVKKVVKHSSQLCSSLTCFLCDVTKVLEHWVYRSWYGSFTLHTPIST